MLNVKRNVISQQQQSFLDDERKDRVMSMAIGEAAKFSLATSAIVGTGTYLASVHIPKFAKFMSISAKVSLPVMATLFVGTLKFELAIHDMQRNPEKWGLSDEIIQARKVSLMPWHHKVLNYIYDNHYVLIVGLGVPFVGAVLNEQVSLMQLIKLNK